MRAAAGVALGLAVSVAVLTGCGDGHDEQGLDRLGEPEGSLKLVTLPGYAEAEWVAPFERQTGCRVSATTAEAPDEVIRLLRGGGFDGIAARGDVSARVLRA